MDVEVHAFALLQMGNHVKEVPGLRVAFRTQHPHQAFRVLPGKVPSVSKPIVALM
jgi:hypothetical protein